MWKKIHVELEFLRLEFHHLLSQCLCCFFFFPCSSLLQPVIFFFESAFSREVFKSSSTSSSSLVLLLQICVLQRGLRIWYFFLHFWFFIFMVIFVLRLLWNSSLKDSCSVWQIHLYVNNQNSSLRGSISLPNSSLKGSRCYSPQFFPILAN